MAHLGGRKELLGFAHRAVRVLGDLLWLVQRGAKSFLIEFLQHAKSDKRREAEAWLYNTVTYTSERICISQMEGAAVYCQIDANFQIIVGVEL